jgi:micrococcal nuclease
MRRFVPWVLLVVVAATAGRSALGGDEARTPGGALAGRVVRVVDGDTIHVRMDSDGSREKVRYIGVDTPESVKPGTPVQCFAKAAAAANAKLVAGRRVTLEPDAEPRDRYGRLLAYVRVGNRMVNEALVRDGYATPLTIPPNVRHAERFRRLAAEARRAGRGLWRRC